jgi:hypothetical protein
VLSARTETTKARGSENCYWCLIPVVQCCALRSQLSSIGPGQLLWVCYLVMCFLWTSRYRNLIAFSGNIKQRASTSLPVCTVIKYLWSHGGHSDISDHLQTKKHEAGFQAAASSTKITSLFRFLRGKMTLEDIIKKVRSHTATWNMTCPSALVTSSKLVSCMHYRQFSGVRTDVKLLQRTLLEYWQIKNPAVSQTLAPSL